MSAVIGILAAGGSTRMRGRDKLMEDVEGEPLLARQLRISGACGVPVLVALPPDNHARSQIAQEACAEIVAVDASPPGMGDSVAAVAAAAQGHGADALLLLLADMPEIEVEDLRTLLSAAAEAPPGTVVRAASATGQPGHPVVFPCELFPSLQRLTGDTGARQVMSTAAEIQLTRLPGNRALIDLDTPEAWAAWRAARPT